MRIRQVAGYVGLLLLPLVGVETFVGGVCFSGSCTLNPFAGSTHSLPGSVFQVIVLVLLIGVGVYVYRLTNNEFR